MNGLANSLVCSATTEVTAHGFVDISIRGFRLAGEKSRSAHDLTGLTVPTLRNIHVYPRQLYRMGVGGRKTFDCRHRLAGYIRDRRAAGPRRLAVNVNGACAAYAHAASKLGAGQSQ